MWKRDTSFKLALRNVNLTPLQQSILEQRYINVLASMKRRCYLLSIYFNVSRFIVTVGSLIVPALLSIQYTGSSPGAGNTSIEIYWATWVISLLVTTSNGVVNMFKIDKKYYFLHTTYEHLRSEGWQYLELSGKYSGFYTPEEKSTHDNQFIFFCHSVEKIKMKQIEEEYYKLTESHTTAAPSVTTVVQNTCNSEAEAVPKEKNLDSLIPPTPLKPILDTLQSLPAELIRELLQKKSLTSIEENAQQRDTETETEIKSPKAAQGHLPMSIILSETTNAE
jgi:hypothetical protein